MATKELEKRIAKLEEVEAEAAKFKAMVETSPDAIFTTDFQQPPYLTYANQAAHELFGCNYELQEMIGQPGTNFWPEEDIPFLVNTILPTVLAGGFRGEVRQKRADGTIFDASVVVFALRDSAGQPIGLVASVRDITERKQTEQAMRESEMNFRGFAEASSYGFGMGQLTGQLVFANHALLNILDEEKPEEAYTKTFFDYYPPADQERLQNEILPIVLQKGQWVGKIPLLSSKGRLTPTEQNIFLIYNEQGQPRMVGNIITDITAHQQEAAERARLQQEVIQAQQHAIQELSTPIIPVMDRILVMPLIGSIDSLRARDITRTLLAGITQHRAKVVILDVTGVGIMDTGIVNHLNKTIQAARLKGAQTIVTGMSDAVAEAIVDLGIDWSGVETLSDLQTGLMVALNSLGIKMSK